MQYFRKEYKKKPDIGRIYKKPDKIFFVGIECLARSLVLLSCVTLDAELE